MARILRDRGCALCIKRRVKCDLTRPICKNCQKGNRPCPGYEDAIRFQDEGQKLRAKYETPRQPTNSNAGKELENPQFATDSSSNMVWRQGNENLVDVRPKQMSSGVIHLPTFSQYGQLTQSQDSGIQDSFDFVSEWRQAPDIGEKFENDQREIESLQLSPAIASVNLNQIQLFELFASATNTADREIIFRHNARWFSYLPAYTGENTLLDFSVRAISLAHIARVQGSDVYMNEARPYYGKALRCLGHILQDQVQSMQASTLCATILLSFYEMYASGSHDSWIRHAGGAGALMRVRGPKRHRYGIDREMFLCFRHQIVVEAFLEDLPCFLDEPQWKALSKHIRDDLHQEYNASASALQLFDHAEAYFNEFAATPGLFYRAICLKADSLQLEHGDADVADFVDRCRAHRMRLKGTFSQFRAVLAENGTSPTTTFTDDEVFPVHYHYSNIHDALITGGYWAVLIMLNTLILQFDDDPKLALMYGIENKDVARDCCMSAEYMLGCSFTGAFFVIYILRIALSVFPVQTFEHDWVVKKLYEIGKEKLSVAVFIPGLDQTRRGVAWNVEGLDVYSVQQF